VLTVVGTERFQEFADKLQKEIEDDTGIRFGVVEKHEFAGIAATNPATGRTEPLGLANSTALWTHLQQAGHVNAAGKVTYTGVGGRQDLDAAIANALR
jgi:type III restriction enzyme